MADFDTDVAATAENAKCSTTGQKSRMGLCIERLKASSNRLLNEDSEVFSGRIPGEV